MALHGKKQKRKEQLKKGDYEKLESPYLWGKGLFWGSMLFSFCTAVVLIWKLVPQNGKAGALMMLFIFLWVTFFAKGNLRWGIALLFSSVTIAISLLQCHAVWRTDSNRAFAWSLSVVGICMLQMLFLCISPPIRTYTAIEQAIKRIGRDQEKISLREHAQAQLPQETEKADARTSAPADSGSLVLPALPYQRAMRKPLQLMLLSLLVFIVLLCALYFAVRGIENLQGDNDTVHFYNKGFEQAVRQELEIPEGTPIRRRDLDAITFIGIDFQHLVDYISQPSMADYSQFQQTSMAASHMRYRTVYGYYEPSVTLSTTVDFRDSAYEPDMAADRWMTFLEHQRSTANPDLTTYPIASPLYSLRDLRHFHGLQALYLPAGPSETDHYSMEQLAGLENLEALYFTEKVNAVEYLSGLQTLRWVRIDSFYDFMDVFPALSDCPVEELTVSFSDQWGIGLNAVAAFSDLRAVYLGAFGADSQHSTYDLQSLETLTQLELLVLENMKVADPTVLHGFPALTRAQVNGAIEMDNK